jgi:hypothetical protein
MKDFPKENIIDKWLDKNGTKEIEKQVENEYKEIMKTAVEWFYQRMFAKDITAVFEQAKEMEKQQIFESWDNGFDNGNYYGKYNENCEINCGEQYYNDTFKK